MIQGKSMCINGRLVQNVPQGLNTRSARSARSSLSVVKHGNRETARGLRQNGFDIWRQTRTSHGANCPEENCRRRRGVTSRSSEGAEGRCIHGRHLPLRGHCTRNSKGSSRPRQDFKEWWFQCKKTGSQTSH